MKHKTLSHTFLFSLIIGLIATLSVSCEKKELQFGSQFVNNSYTDITETDTITPVLSTIFIDSFPTSNSGVGLIGHTVDPLIGTLNAAAYFQLGVPPFSATSTKYEQAKYDSVTLFLKIKKGSWYGDTTKPINLNVYKITEQILPKGNNGSLYNNNSFKTESTLLGKYSFKLRPNAIDSTNDTLSIRLVDALGKSLFSKLQNSDASIQSNDQFVNYFKGIKVVADASSNLSFAVSDSVQLRVYYSAPVFPNVSNTYATFGLYNSAAQFNSVSIQRTGLLAKAGFGHNNYMISSTKTDSTAYMQPLANALVKINFPSLLAVQQQHFIKVSKATLYIKPKVESFQKIFNLPPYLYLVPTDGTNSLLGTPINGLAGSSPQNGSLQASYVDPGANSPYYTYDLTFEIQSLLADPSANYYQKGLMLMPNQSSLFSSYNRIIVGDGDNSKAEMKLIIDYISIR